MTLRDYPTNGRTTDSRSLECHSPLSATQTRYGVHNWLPRISFNSHAGWLRHDDAFATALCYNEVTSPSGWRPNKVPLGSLRVPQVLGSSPDYTTLVTSDSSHPYP